MKEPTATETYFKAEPWNELGMNPTYAYIADAVSRRVTGKITPDLIAYTTKGGAYMLATDPKWTDSGKPRDLIVILPAPLERSRVVPLWYAVNPDLVEALRRALD